jgi:hypothetical protein
MCTVHDGCSPSNNRKRSSGIPGSPLVRFPCWLPNISCAQWARKKVPAKGQASQADIPKVWSDVSMKASGRAPKKGYQKGIPMIYLDQWKHEFDVYQATPWNHNRWIYSKGLSESGGIAAQKKVDGLRIGWGHQLEKPMPSVAFKTSKTWSMHVCILVHICGTKYGYLSRWIVI